MFVARYRGSALGLIWAVLTPAVMIAVFTFLFAVVFNARFKTGGSPLDYALYLFCGLLPWTAFSESLQQSSGVVVAHTNLVKRVVFPLEALPVFSLFFMPFVISQVNVVAIAQDDRQPLRRRCGAAARRGSAL